MTTADRAYGMTPLFLSGTKGKLFAIHFYPAESWRSGKGVVLFPPFAEEMNKSRRMLALQARYLAAQGHEVLILDLFGTGDSQGEFSQARWDVWLDDICKGADWLLQRNIDSLSFLALRFGSLLATEASTIYRDRLEKLVLWQPVVNGQIFMNQFLRLRLAAGMINNTNKMTVKGLREMLDNGQSVEVAGYNLASELVTAIDQKSLAHTRGEDLPAVYWFDVVGEASRPLSVASMRIVQGWQNSNPHIETGVIIGEPFWGTTEITTIPGLLRKTCDVM